MPHADEHLTEESAEKRHEDEEAQQLLRKSAEDEALARQVKDRGSKA